MKWFDITPNVVLNVKIYIHHNIWVFPKIGIPQNGRFIMENPIKMDDLGIPLLVETPISCHNIIYIHDLWFTYTQQKKKRLNNSSRTPSPRISRRKNKYPFTCTEVRTIAIALFLQPADLMRSVVGCSCCNSFSTMDFFLDPGLGERDMCQVYSMWPFLFSS